MKRRSTCVLILSLLVASCGDDSVLAPAPSSTIADGVTTTAAAETTSAPEVVTSTEAPTTSMSVVTTTTAAATTTSAAATTTTAAAGPTPTPSGSGCTPGADTLPDGDWFGFVEGIDTRRDVFITLDLACYFDGEDADLAAAEDGHPLPLEFSPYVRNRNPRTFEIPVSPATTVDDYIVGTVSFEDWVLGMNPENGCSEHTGYRACPLWVQIHRGEAVFLYGLLPEWAGDGRGS